MLHEEEPVRFLTFIYTISTILMAEIEAALCIYIFIMPKTVATRCKTEITRKKQQRT